eukprot:1159583-Pelagomonas_calceolata.AAC.1
MIPTLISKFQMNNFGYTAGLSQLTSHAGIAIKECADDIVRHQANQANKGIATGIPSAGPSRNPEIHFPKPSG